MNNGELRYIGLTKEGGFDNDNRVYGPEGGAPTLRTGGSPGILIMELYRI